MQAFSRAAIGMNGGASSSGVLSPSAHQILERAMQLNEAYLQALDRQHQEIVRLRILVQKLEGQQTVLEFGATV